MALDLVKLEKMLDEALAKETPESWALFLKYQYTHLCDNCLYYKEFDEGRGICNHHKNNSMGVEKGARCSYHRKVRELSFDPAEEYYALSTSPIYNNCIYYEVLKELEKLEYEYSREN